jgi:hypothetical protein
MLPAGCFVHVREKDCRTRDCIDNATECPWFPERSEVLPAAARQLATAGDETQHFTWLQSQAAEGR